ncbi:MAG: hypothetical protein WC506_01635 [Candidatus Micrarchaeia archaeon]
MAKKSTGKASAAKSVRPAAMPLPQSQAKPAQEDEKVRILGIPISKKTVILNLAVMAAFALLVLAFLFFVRTGQYVHISETSYQRTANLALRAGESYVYKVNSDIENSTVNFTVSDGGDCKQVDMQSQGATLMSFCLGYDGKPVIYRLPKEQRENPAILAVANSSLGMPNAPLKPWMLGLGDGFYYQANLTYVSTTEGLVQSSGVIGNERIEAIYAGNGTIFGREAYKVLLRSTTESGIGEYTVWVDAQKRVMLYMTGINETTTIVSAPFPLEN